MKLAAAVLALALLAVPARAAAIDDIQKAYDSGN